MRKAFAESILKRTRGAVAEVHSECGLWWARLNGGISLWGPCIKEEDIDLLLKKLKVGKVVKVR